MISLMIIDGEEVCLTGGEGGPTWDQKTLLVKNSLFTKAIQEHFDILWRNSIKLNERGIRNDFIDELEKNISN